MRSSCFFFFFFQQRGSRCKEGRPIMYTAFVLHSLWRDCTDAINDAEVLTRANIEEKENVTFLGKDEGGVYISCTNMEAYERSPFDSVLFGYRTSLITEKTTTWLDGTASFCLLSFSTRLPTKRVSGSFFVSVFVLCAFTKKKTRWVKTRMQDHPE